MICINCASEDMKFVTCYDGPKTGFSWNLYSCDSCGWICKEDVWDNAGQTWLPLKGVIKRVLPVILVNSK